MDYFSWQFIIWATALGALSAVSLPMGSLVALRINPRPAFISIMAAFGAGALIAALSVELVAPTVFALFAKLDARQIGAQRSGDWCWRHYQYRPLFYQ